MVEVDSRFRGNDGLCPGLLPAGAGSAWKTGGREA